jgi:hypothetical protein
MGKLIQFRRIQKKKAQSPELSPQRALEVEKRMMFLRSTYGKQIQGGKTDA